MKAGLSPHWRMPWPLAVLGAGTALPGKPMDSGDLIALIEQRFALGRERQARALARQLAIGRRHVCRAFDARHECARPGQSNPELAAQAVSAALAEAGLRPNDLGYLIGHTTTPLHQLPANVAWVADHLGYEGPHVELRQACTGFANALMIASGLLAAPGAKPVAIVGSETGSLFFDPLAALEDDSQLVNMMQMGDGAGAIVLAPAGAAPGRLREAWFGTLGNGRMPGISLSQERPGEFAHDFEAILRSGGELFATGIAVAARMGVDASQVPAIIPHQTSGRIGQQLAHHLELPEDRFFVQAGRLGNTGSAAIWLAFDEWRRQGQGQQVLTLGAEASKFFFGGFLYDRG